MLAPMRYPVGRWTRVMILSVTLAVASVESFVFEVIRMPYAPPRDISTLLGAGEIGVAAMVMFGIASGFALYLIRCLLVYRFNSKEYLVFTVFAGALLAAHTLLILFPPWPVTPYWLMHW